MLTTEANSLTAALLDRMPEMIGDESPAKWFGEEPSSPAEPRAMLAPFPAERVAVAKIVGQVKNQGRIGGPDSLKFECIRG